MKKLDVNVTVINSKNRSIELIVAVLLLTSAAIGLAVECFGTYIEKPCSLGWPSGGEAVVCNPSTCEPLASSACLRWNITAVDGSCGRDCDTSRNQTGQTCVRASDVTRTKVTEQGDPVCTDCKGGCINWVTSTDDNFQAPWVEMSSEGCDNPYE